jgi:hypothetical protein
MKVIKFTAVFFMLLVMCGTVNQLEARGHSRTTFGISLGNLFSIVQPQPVYVERRVVVHQMPVRQRLVAPAAIAGPVLAYPSYPCYEEVYVYPRPAPVYRNSGISFNWQYSVRH